MTKKKKVSETVSKPAVKTAAKPVSKIATEVIRTPTIKTLRVRNVSGQKIPFHYRMGDKRIHLNILSGQVVTLTDSPDVRLSLQKFRDSLFIV